MIVGMGLARRPPRELRNMAGPLADWDASRTANMAAANVLWDSGPESLLDDPTGQDAQELHDKLERALLYISNWYKAVEGSARQSTWWQRIDQLRSKVERALKLMDPATLFPGNAARAAYNDAALSFPGLWRELTLSSDTFLHPGLLDEAADSIFAPVVKIGQAAGQAVDAAAAAVRRGLGLAEDTASTVKWTVIGLGAVAVAFVFYLTFETGRTARAIAPSVLR